MWRAALLVLAACRFEPGSFAQQDAPDELPPDDAPIDTRPVDAAIDARVCPAAPPTCTAFTCGESSSCYYICGNATSGKQSYAGARMSCANANVGCIVTIDSQDENDCIAAMTQPSFPNALVWFGYEQASNGQEPAGGWSWRCGSSSFLAPNWGDFEPNNVGNGEDCAVMTAGGAWLDADCGGSARFVCELP